MIENPLNETSPVPTLQLSEKFVAKYKLEKVINDTIYFHLFLSSDLSHTINYPLWLINDNHIKENPAEFLKLIETHLKKFDINEKHRDPLIIFSKVLQSKKSEKRAEIFKENCLRSNGKLLLDLIRFPFQVYDLRNFHEKFDAELFDDELEDQLFMYLGIVSDLPEETFKDDHGNLDRKKISPEIDYYLKERLTADKNISVKLEDSRLPRGFKYLIISSDVSIKFKSTKPKAKSNTSPLYKHQTDGLIRLIVNQLVDEQRAERTDLYEKLLDHDFFTDASYLKKFVGTWAHSSHLGHNLYRLYKLLIAYLNDENILYDRSNPITNRKRSNFVLRYFILMGWTNHRGNFLESTNMLSVKEELNKLNNTISDNPNHSSKILNDIFKPIK